MFKEAETAARLMQFPALSLMVFLRRDLGYRVLNPVHLVFVCGFIALIAIFAEPNHPEAKTSDLLAFALVAFVIGMLQRLARWVEFHRGVKQHSYYIGTSFFDFRWLPKFVRRNRLMARYVDPICTGLVGWFLIPTSPALAYWLIFSAISLRVLEDIVRRRERTMKLDMLDNIINSEHQSETVEEFDEAPDPRQQKTPTAVPTGLASDIKDHIKRRKARK